MEFDVQAKVQSKPVPHWEERFGQLTTFGDRDVIIIASFGEATARIVGVVPRSPHEPTEEDKRSMVDQGLIENVQHTYAISKIAYIEHVHIFHAHNVTIFEGSTIQHSQVN